MSAKACRICLIMEVKLYSIKREPLKTAVEIILPLDGDPSCFPQFMCYECTAIILKCLKFIEKSRLSENILYDIYDMHGEVSNSALKAVNRKISNLESNIKIDNSTPNSCIQILDCDIENPLSAGLQQYDTEEESNSFIDIHDYETARAPNKMAIISIEQVPNSVETEPIDLDGLEENESNIILSLDDDSDVLGDAANEVDLENEILLEAGEETESLFVFDVDLNLERSKFDSIALPLPKSNGCSKAKKSNRNDKQTKPKTKSKKSTSAQPKRKDKTANGRKGRVKKRKRKKDCDVNLREHFNIVLLTHKEQLAEIEARKLEPGYASYPYKCDKCFRCYRKADAYSNHMQEHHPSRGSLECAVCKKRFTTRSVLERHIVCCHQRHYHCKLCAFTGKNRQALVHLKKHQGEERVLKCAHCKFVTVNLSEMSRHMSLRHGGGGGRGRVCERCGRKFATQRGHKQHLTRARCQRKTDKEHTEYSCDQCTSKFILETDLTKHVQDKHKGEIRNFCEICKETFINIGDLAEHNTALHRSEDAYPVNCSHCNAIILSSTAYWRHIVRNHPMEKKNYRSPKRTFLCDICGKGFKSVTELRCHIVRHTSRRAVPCAECPRLFYDHYQARMHRKNVHSDQRPHKCSLCSLSFKVKSNLTRHMVVHTGERAHTCSLCSKSFTQASSRDLHVRAVHYKIPYPSRGPRKPKKRAVSSKNVEKSNVDNTLQKE